MKWLALIVSLSLLIMTHELGHLGFAKLFHTRVRRYYIFFNWGFSILKAKKFGGKWHFLFFNATTPESWDEKNLAPEDQNNTLWGIGWLPLGGYCDIAGMIDETKGADDLPSEVQPWEFRAKPAWQRLCITAGGVLVNFVSALLLFTLIFSHWGKDELPLRNATLGYDYEQVFLDEGFQNGDIIYQIDGKDVYDLSDASMAMLLNHPREVMVLRGDTFAYVYPHDDLLEKITRKNVKQMMAPRMPFVVHDFVAGSQAAKAGMQPGDSVVSIDGKPMASYREITAALAEYADQTISIGFYRNGTLDSLPVHVDNTGKLGIQLESDISKLFVVQHHDYTFWQAIPAGISYGWKTLVDYVSSLKIIFAPGGLQSLGGFGTMSSIFPDHWNWYAFWNITALLALILAFMNIIPIPGLDGGHILFTLWEMVTGKAPSDKFLTVAQNIGMILILALMVVANGNDLWRWISGMM